MHRLNSFRLRPWRGTLLRPTHRIQRTPGPPNPASSAPPDPPKRDPFRKSGPLNDQEGKEPLTLRLLDREVTVLEKRSCILFINLVQLGPPKRFPALQLRCCQKPLLSEAPSGPMCFCLGNPVPLCAALSESPAGTRMGLKTTIYKSFSYNYLTTI